MGWVYLVLVRRFLLLPVVSGGKRLANGSRFPEKYPYQTRSRSVPDVVVLNSQPIKDCSLSANVFQGSSKGIFSGNRYFLGFSRNRKTGFVERIFYWIENEIYFYVWNSK